MPKVIMASMFTKVELDSEMLKPDWAPYILTLIKTIHQSKRRVKQGKAKREQPSTLGGTHMLTRLIYFALGKIDQLPQSVEDDPTLPQKTRAYS